MGCVASSEGKVLAPASKAGREERRAAERQGRPAAAAVPASLRSSVTAAAVVPSSSAVPAEASADGKLLPADPTSVLHSTDSSAASVGTPPRPAWQPAAPVSPAMAEGAAGACVIAPPAAAGGGQGEADAGGEFDARPCEARPMPTNFTEYARMEALRSLEVLDTEPEARFDSITTLMAHLFRVPVAVVSLIDRDRLWFKSVAGAFPRSINRAGSFCNATLAPATPELLVIEDTLQDARFRNSPVVAGPPYIRFFVGTPLVSTLGGARLGTLCIIDFQPRHFTVEEYQLLCHFGEITCRELERSQVIRWQSQELESAHIASRRMLRALDSFDEGLVLVDVSQPHWPMLYSNSAFADATGVHCDRLTASAGFWQVFEHEGEGSDEAASNVAAAIDRSVSFELDARAAAHGGPAVPPFTLHFRCADTEQLSDEQPAVGVPAQVELSTTTPPELASVLGRDKVAALAAALSTVQAGSLELGRPAARAAAAGAGAELVQGGEEAALEEELVRAGLGAGDGKASPSPAAGDGCGGSVDGTLAAPSPGTDSRDRSLHGRKSSGRIYYFGVLRPRKPAPAAAPAPATPSSQIASSASEDVGGELPVLHRASQGPSSAESTPRGAVALAGPTRASQVLPDTIPAFYQLRPEVLSEVTLGPLIGTGSTGRCYRGMWQGGRVAVKILDNWVDARAVSELQRSRSMESEFRCAKAAVVEALLSRCLSHPHVVPTYQAGVATEQLEGTFKVHQQVWIVQQYCNRGTLLNAVETGAFHDAEGRPDLSAVLATAQECAGAMAYLHSHGVLHGDLTGKNVLLVSAAKDARRWVAQVADFGLAQCEDGGLRSALGYGTVTHMPPELLSGGPMTPGVDVYSFGCLLVEMWTGKRAWAGMGPMQVLHKVAVQRQALPLPADAPAGLRGLMERCLSADPAVRPPFSAVLAEVQAMAKAAAPPRKAPHAPGIKKTSSPRRRGSAEAAAAAAQACSSSVPL